MQKKKSAMLLSRYYKVLFYLLICKDKVLNVQATLYPHEVEQCFYMVASLLTFNLLSFAENHFKESRLYM